MLLTSQFQANVGPYSDRTDDQIKEMQGKIENKKGEIIQLQASLQGGSGAPGKVAAKG